MKANAELAEVVGPPCWRVSPPDFYEFLRSLPALAPGDSVLRLEGVEQGNVEAYLLGRPADRENETDQGFWKLRPKIFYTPVTEENLAGLAALSERFAEPEVCAHVCVYRGDRIILSWHDLPSDPIYVSREIDEAALKRFCEILRCEYAAEDD
ncbi:MAG TPA: hypothetical protein VIP46_10130 [Pyrinomonadaceae bacterium]